VCGFGGSVGEDVCADFHPSEQEISFLLSASELVRSGDSDLDTSEVTSYIHQKKKSAFGRTGCVQMHQVLGTLWTHPVSVHTAPNAKCTGNVNSDAARHGTVRPDTDRHGICLPDRVWQGIFLLDTAVSGHFPSGRSRVWEFSYWTRRVMAARSHWLSRCGTSQLILGSYSQTRSRFQA